MLNSERMSRDAEQRDRSSRSRDLEMQHVRDTIERTRHGEVRVIIQDGFVVQIDHTEKQRLR